MNIRTMIFIAAFICAMPATRCRQLPSVHYGIFKNSALASRECISYSYCMLMKKLRENKNKIDEKRKLLFDCCGVFEFVNTYMTTLDLNKINE